MNIIETWGGGIFVHEWDSDVHYGILLGGGGWQMPLVPPSPGLNPDIVYIA